MNEAVVGGAYRVGERVGGEGRVSVHLANDEAGTQFVVSFVEPRDESETALLLQRAATASEVQHRYVAQVVASGMDEGRFFVVREYVQGEDLASLLKRRQTLDWVSAARYLTFVAAGLAEAADKGLAHGALRPERLVLTPDGTVKVTGLELPPEVVVDELNDLTPPEDVLYLSPEQASGQTATPQSDIYAQGVMFYQFVTGVVPFDAATGVVVASEHRTAEPERPRRVNPDVSPSAEAVIMRALAKDPADRQAGEAELARELDALVVGGAGEAEYPTRRRVWPWVLLAAFLLLLGVVAYMFLTQLYVPVPDVRGLPVASAEEELTAGGYWVGDVSYDPAAASSAETGSVVTQFPSAGTRTRAGVVVDLVVAGAELVTVPDVVRTVETEAAARLGQAGLGVDVQDVPSSTEQPGTVLSQEPIAGARVPKSSTVVIAVASGPKMAVVPNVVGQTQQAATSAVTQAGFAVTLTEAFSPTAAVGVVISQSPPAGVSAEASATVTLSISKGPEPVAKVRVPNLVGLAESAARDELQALGLKAKVVLATDPANVGRVKAQNPTAGTMVLPDTVVTITVGAP